MAKWAPQLMCALLMVASCTSPEPEEYRNAQQAFDKSKPSYAELLKAVTECRYQPTERGKASFRAIILADAQRSAEFGSCGDDKETTGAISVLLRRVGASSVAWYFESGASGKQGAVNFFYSDRYVSSTKTRSTMAIAYYVPAIQKPKFGEDNGACQIDARALTSDPPYNWLWVSRKFKTDDTANKWCAEDLVL